MYLSSTGKNVLKVILCAFIVIVVLWTLLFFNIQKYFFKLYIYRYFIVIVLGVKWPRYVHYSIQQQHTSIAMETFLLRRGNKARGGSKVSRAGFMHRHSRHVPALVRPGGAQTHMKRYTICFGIATIGYLQE